MLKIKKWLILILAFGLTFFFWLIKIKPSLWRRQYQFNLALVGPNNLILLAADPMQKTAFGALFPGNLLVESFGGYGQLRVGKIDDLALQEGEESIIPKTIEQYFGFPLDFWIYEPARFDDEGINLKSIKRRIKGLIFSTQKLSFSDRINLFYLSHFLSDNRLLWQFNQNGMEFCQEQEDVYSLDREKWDDWASVYLADSTLKDERIAVGVYNAAGSAGLAREFARVLTNAGLVVVATKDTDRLVENCLVGLKSEQVKRSRAFARLNRLTRECQVEVLSAKEFVDSTRINVYLGENFLKIR